MRPPAPSQAVFALDDADPLPRAAEVGLGELRRVVAAAAVDEVVRLVDEEEGVARARGSRARPRARRPGRRRSCSRRSRRRLARRARARPRTGRPPRRGPPRRRVGSRCRRGLEEPVEETGGFHLRGVVLRERGSGPRGRGRRRSRTSALSRGGGRTGRSRRRSPRASSRRSPAASSSPSGRRAGGRLRERPREEREERGGRLPDARRRLDEEVLALRAPRAPRPPPSRAGPGGTSRSGKTSVVRLGGLRLGEGALLEELRRGGCPDPPHEVGVESSSGSGATSMIFVAPVSMSARTRRPGPRGPRTRRRRACTTGAAAGSARGAASRGGGRGPRRSGATSPRRRRRGRRPRSARRGGPRGRREVVDREGEPDRLLHGVPGDRGRGARRGRGGGRPARSRAARSRRRGRSRSAGRGPPRSAPGEIETVFAREVDRDRHAHSSGALRSNRRW